MNSTPIKASEDKWPVVGGADQVHIAVIDRGGAAFVCGVNININTSNDRDDEK